MLIIAEATLTVLVRLPAYARDIYPEQGAATDGNKDNTNLDVRAFLRV